MTATAEARRIRTGDDRLDRAIRRSRAVAEMLDSAFALPGTNIRFGLDSVIGLVPVLGDTATAVVGLYPIVEATRLGVRKRVVAKMLGHVGVDWLIGLIPLVDIVFDVAYKSNLRNARLLTAELESRRDALRGGAA